MWIAGYQYCQPNLHHNKHKFVCFINNIIIFNIGMMDLIGIPFKTHLAQNVSINSITIVYVFVKTQITLTMVYILVKMHLGSTMVDTPFITHLTLVMPCVLIKMGMAQAMVYILIRRNVCLT